MAKKKKVVVQLKGGLGNQMFQYAIGRSMAIRNDADLYFDCSVLNNRKKVSDYTFREYNLDIFDNISGIIADESNVPQFSSKASIRSKLFNVLHYIRLRFSGFNYVFERKFNYNNKLFRNDSSKIYLNGYWQSYKYFTEIEDLIRSELTSFKFVNRNLSLIDSQIKSCDAICLHIRRTDFLTTTLHSVVSENYVNTAVKIIEGKVKNPIFFVFSDDLIWCKEHISIPYTTIFVEDSLAGEKAEGHFYLMSQCKHFIISNSTFSWWAAWLSSADKNKIVITPDKWFNSSIIVDDLIPHNWIRI